MKKRSTTNRKVSKRRMLQILNWAEKNGRLPNRRSLQKTERKLGSAMENYLCVSSSSFDAEFYTLVHMLYNRTPNNKRKHEKEVRIKNLLSFIEENNRIPTRTSSEEKELYNVYKNYTTPSAHGYSTSLTKKIAKIDKCFKTGIPCKYRAQINESVDAKLIPEKINTEKV